MNKRLIEVLEDAPHKNASITLRPHEWGDLIRAAISRIRECGGDPFRDLVAIRVEWPIGVNAPESIVPGMAELTVRGLRNQGFNVGSIERLSVTYHDIPLVVIQAVHTARTIREIQDPELRASVAAVYGLSTEVSTHEKFQGYGFSGRYSR